MRYDENYLSEKQEKRVMKFLKTFQKYYKLDDLPDCSILGLNPEDDIAKMEPLLAKMSELYELAIDKKSKKELKKEFKELKAKKTRLRNESDYRVKMVFPFNDELKQMTVMSEWRPGAFLGSGYYSYTCLLDYVIECPVIFGRKAWKKMHGFGKFFFAPMEFKLPALENKVDEAISAGTIDEFLLNFTRSNPMIEMLDMMCLSREAFEQMRIMHQINKDKEYTGIDLIDKLNEKNDLIKKMKKLCHFGQYNGGISKNVSEVDVSTLCLPMKRGTLLYLIDYQEKYNKSLDAIHALSDVLRRF